MICSQYLTARFMEVHNDQIQNQLKKPHLRFCSYYSIFTSLVHNSLDNRLSYLYKQKAGTVTEILFCITLH